MENYENRENPKIILENKIGNVYLYIVDFLVVRQTDRRQRCKATEYLYSQNHSVGYPCIHTKSIHICILQCVHGTKRLMQLIRSNVRLFEQLIAYSISYGFFLFPSPLCLPFFLSFSAAIMYTVYWYILHRNI